MGKQNPMHVVTRPRRGVGDIVGDKVGDGAGDNAKSMSGRDFTEKRETWWETKWDTNPDAYRRRISQNSGRHFRKRAGR